MLAALAALGWLGGGTDAAAIEYKCACEASHKADVESAGPNACVETYDGYTGSVSVQERDLKVYVDDDNVVRGHQRMNMRFRPRNGKCLDVVLDKHAGYWLYKEHECRASQYQEVGKFELWGGKSTGLWTASFDAHTTGKDYTGFASFNEKDGRYYMRALCVQNK
jgi:hypothetical protein